MSHPPKPDFKARYPKVSWLIVTSIVVYIAGIGIPAIEELKARTDASTNLTARQLDILRDLSNGGALTQDQRDALEKERAFVGELQRGLVSLSLNGAIANANGKVVSGTLAEILCRWTSYPTANADCPVREPSAPSRFFLKAESERSATGAVLAVLIVTAAFGGALVRLSLPNVNESWSDVLRPLLRAVGGGIVCYLVIRGNGFPGAIVDVSSYSNPATASLAGFLSGMFSKQVFELLTDLVEALADKIRPAKKEDKSTQITRTTVSGGALVRQVVPEAETGKSVLAPPT